MYVHTNTPSVTDLDALTDDQLIAAFTSCRIGPDAFRHRHHVRVAYLYLQRHPLGAAIDLFRADLRRFAQSIGAPTLYHETITLGYLLLVHERMADAVPTWGAFAAANPDLLAHRGGAFERLYAGTDLDDDGARRWFRLPDSGRSSGQPEARAVAQRAI